MDFSSSSQSIPSSYPTPDDHLFANIPGTQDFVNNAAQNNNNPTEKPAESDRSRGRTTPAASPTGPYIFDPSLKSWIVRPGIDGKSLSWSPDMTGKSCRAYRMFPADRFVWRQLSLEMANNQGEIAKALDEILVRNDEDGTVHTYTFFGTTESRLKSNVIGYFEEAPGMMVTDLLNSFGKLKPVLRDHGVGKYIARLSLSFSSSIPVGAFHKSVIAKLKDREAKVKGKIHSDGCGIITEECARDVAKKLGLDYTPSVFQFRYGGHKGILTTYTQDDISGSGKYITEHQWPEGNKFLSLGLRPSQHKYESTLTELEITDWSKPSKKGYAKINKSYIRVLSYLGVEDSVFFALLKKETDRLDLVLSDRESALTYIQQDRVDEEALELTPRNIGTFSSKESRRNLDCLVKGDKKRLREKLNLPVEQSARLFGTLDEGGKLKENQIYLHVSGEGFIKGPVMITRDPCGHPGDIRKMQAIHPPPSALFRDVVVFPKTCASPLADAMSGGDLDGDQYFVCWNSILLPPKTVPFNPRLKEPTVKRIILNMPKCGQDPIKEMKAIIPKIMTNHELEFSAQEWAKAEEVLKLGVGDRYCIAWQDRYEACLDATKHGNDVPDKPSAQLKGSPRKKEDSIIQKLLAKIPADATTSTNATTFELDPDLVYQPKTVKGTKDWADGVKLFYTLKKSWGIRFAQVRDSHDARYTNGALDPALVLDVLSAKRKLARQEALDYELRGVIAAYSKEFFYSSPFEDQERMRVMASAMYVTGYRHKMEESSSFKKLELCWLGISYLNAMKSAWVRYRCEGVGPALSIAPMRRFVAIEAAQVEEMDD